MWVTCVLTTYDMIVSTSLISWKSFIFDATIDKSFEFLRKKRSSLIQSLNMWTFIDIYWDKKFKSIAFILAEFQLLKCKQTISSKFFLVRNRRNSFDNCIWSTFFIYWSIKRQSQHNDVKTEKICQIIK